MTAIFNIVVLIFTALVSLVSVANTDCGKSLKVSSEFTRPVTPNSEKSMVVSAGEVLDVQSKIDFRIANLLAEGGYNVFIPSRHKDVQFFLSSGYSIFMSGNRTISQDGKKWLAQQGLTGRKINPNFMVSGNSGEWFAFSYIQRNANEEGLLDTMSEALRRKVDNRFVLELATWNAKDVEEFSIYYEDYFNYLNSLGLIEVLGVARGNGIMRIYPRD